jgi:hypothetical protein
LGFGAGISSGDRRRKRRPARARLLASIYRDLGLVRILHQDWRIEDHQQAIVAFRVGISPLTLARPSR